MPGTRAFEDERVVELRKQILEQEKLLRQLKHQLKLLKKHIENEV